MKFPDGTQYDPRPADQPEPDFEINSTSLSPAEYKQALKELLEDPTVPHTVKEEAISRGPAFFVRPRSEGGADIPRPYTPADLYQRLAEEARRRGKGKKGE